MKSKVNKSSTFMRLHTSLFLYAVFHVLNQMLYYMYVRQYMKSVVMTARVPKLSGHLRYRDTLLASNSENVKCILFQRGLFSMFLELT